MTPTPKPPTPEADEQPAAEERRAPMLEIALLEPDGDLDGFPQIPAGACAFYDEDD